MNTQEDKLEISESDDLKAHYDFDYSKAKPNRFAARLAQEQLMVVIDPDIAAIFPTSEAVNEALRILANAAQHLSHTNPQLQDEPNNVVSASEQNTFQDPTK